MNLFRFVLDVAFQFAHEQMSSFPMSYQNVYSLGGVNINQ